MEGMTNESQSDQSVGQTSDNVSGENQEVQNVESTETEGQATLESSESDTHDTQKEEGNESVDNQLPANASDREKAALRKMHEATQEASRYRKEADAFQQLLNHPEFNEFLQWQKNKGNQPASQPQQPQQAMNDLTEDELIELQSNPKKFNEVLESRIGNILNPIAQQAIQKINGLERELAISKQEREIDAFAAKHPDFWSKNPDLMKAAISKTKDLAKAYSLVNQWEKAEQEKALAAHQKKVQEKKQATSASPSRSIEPKVIYAENETDANRMAFEYAKQGKRVDVRIGKKK